MKQEAHRATVVYLINSFSNEAHGAADVQYLPPVKFP